MTKTLRYTQRIRGPRSRASDSSTLNLLKFYKLNPNAKAPIFATEGSACFDIHASLIRGEKVKLYTSNDEFDQQRIMNVIVESTREFVTAVSYVIDVVLKLLRKRYVEIE